MRKKQLEITLQRVEGFRDPDAELEQYDTPAPIAAEILHLAHARGDLHGHVLDLGCGTGIFAIGATLLGANATGIDLDPDALNTAKRNARNLGVEVNFKRSDVNQIDSLRGDLVIQNPPFGAQKKGADRPFIAAALKTATVTYSLHNHGTGEFVEREVERLGGTARHEATYRFPLPRRHHFHSKEIQEVSVDLYRFENPGETRASGETDVTS